MGSVIENEELIKVSEPEVGRVIELDTVFQPTVQNAFVVLNQEIKLVNFTHIWHQYQLKIAVDGGANRLYDHFDDESRELYIPAFIVGDFDSLRPEVGEWYLARGTRILKQETQYATDLGKCLDLVELYYKHADFNSLEIDTYDGLIKLHEELGPSDDVKIQVLLLGAIDGRFDHTVQSISTLLKHSSSTPNTALYFVSNTDLILCIPKGVNYINYRNSAELFHGSNNGLLPLGGQVTLTTHGFKWDVTDWPSSMDTSVSTSNRFVGEHGAVVETDEAFVLNIELDLDKLDKS
jgi:thiamine pyrophosphokinase